MQMAADLRVICVRIVQYILGCVGDNILFYDFQPAEQIENVRCVSCAFNK